MNSLKQKKSLRSLTKRRDFQLVFKEGVSLSSHYLVVYARPNELNCNRLGLSVSKKIGNAVVRNRIKRLLRESLRNCLHGWPFFYDFVIVAKKASVEGALDDFIREINKIKNMKTT